MITESINILVVEDYDQVRMLISLWLKAPNVTIHEAKNGAEGFLSAIKNKPDLIITDVDMPIMDGITLTRKLRQNPETSKIPILVTTGVDVNRQLEALANGADDFLAKPIQENILIARVKNMIARHLAEKKVSELVTKLKQYVSNATVRQTTKLLPRENIYATILFSDLRGFTFTSATEEPNQVFDSLNSILGTQEVIISNHQGYVDKFSGDGLLAIFPTENGMQMACTAAAEIVRWASIQQRERFWIKPPVAIGINAGQILRGDIGSKKRKEYTVIGSPVNYAARLCGQAMALEVIVSNDVYEKTKTIFSFAAPISRELKGLKGKHNLYSMIIEKPGT